MKTMTTKLQQAYNDLQVVLNSRQWLKTSAIESEDKAKKMAAFAANQRVLEANTYPEEVRLRALITHLEETNNKDKVERRDDILKKKARLEAQIRELEAQL